MKAKASLLGAMLVGALTAVPVMADNDFHALGQASMVPMVDEELASIEGGNPCSFSIASTCANVAVVTQVNSALIAGVQANVAVVEQEIGD